MDVNKAIQLAHEQFQTGNLQQAEHICRKILKREPNNFDALRFLGVIYFQLGNYDRAGREKLDRYISGKAALN